MGKTILVVDDKESIRCVIEDSLVEIGYDSIICKDGEHAVSYINRVDLLITDFNMPGGMNGAELTKIAKRVKPDMPVIIMTGNPEDIPADHLANAVVKKPFDIEKLMKTITDLL